MPQEMSQTIEETQSKLMSTVEDSNNESSNVISKSSFQSVADSDRTTHDLMDLMERPTLIRTGTIGSSSTVMVYKYDQSTQQFMTTSSLPGMIGTPMGFPSILLQKNPVVASKIKQFSFFKGDLKFQVKVNCPPNVSGALLAVYIPISDNQVFDLSNITVQAMTSYPSKILDYSTDTSLTMSVPYINQYDYYNFSQPLAVPGTDPICAPGNYGALVLFNLQKPLSGSTADKVSYTVFASFENVELKLPVEELAAQIPGPFLAESDTIVQRIPARDIMSGSNMNCNIPLAYNMIEPDNSKVKFDENETSLQYILSRENIIGTITYGENRDAENNSYLGKVRCFPKRPEIACFGKMPIQMGTFDYTCNLFQRYTGTIKIGLRLIKTKFHYGRIAVIFDPFNRLSGKTEPVSIGALLSTNYSMLIDLNSNDGHEGSSNYYSIEVPYMNNAPFSMIGSQTTTSNTIPSKFGVYQPNYEGKPDGSSLVQFQTTGRECYNPYLRFYAVTELGYLSSAASEVPILVSISAGDDFELSIPSVQVSNSARGAPSLLSDIFYCESDLKIISTKSNCEDNLNICVGEKIENLNTIANRFTAPTIVYKKTPAYVTWQREDNIKDVTAVSTDLFPMGATLSLHTNTPNGFQLSNYEAVGNIFKYAYGGRRYKVMSTSKAHISAKLIHVPHFRGNLSVDANAPMIVGSGVTFDALTGQGAYPVAPVSTESVQISGEMVVASDINNYIEVERPFYSNRKLISNKPLINNIVREPESSFNRYFISEDDVMINFVALPIDDESVQNPQRSYTLPVTSDRIRLEGCYIAGVTGDELQMCTSALDEGVYDARGNILDFPGLSFKERNFVHNAGVNPCTIFFRASTLGNVLEALGTNAGFTFLQPPPCVIFG